MSTFQYRVIPAPTKGLKAKGVKGGEARFANAIEDVMNSMASEGWEYQRAETLPSIERTGLTGSNTEWRNVLVFRKPQDADDGQVYPPLMDPPEPEHSEPDQDPFEAAELAQAEPESAPQQEAEDDFDEKTILDLGNDAETKT